MPAGPAGKPRSPVAGTVEPVLSVVLAGGGTAGHVEPALAVADALRRRDPAVRITALGTERGLESRLVPARGYPLAVIPAVPLPRRPSPALLTVPGRLAGAVHAAGAVMESVRADVVIGFGGYVALPAYLAARWRRIPVVVHEANARPGLANRVGARLTPYVATGTPAARLPHAIYVGIPLRAAVASLDRPAMRPVGRASFGLRPELPTLLVFGGSQGARRLSAAVVAAAPELARAGVQVLHATGAAHYDEISARLPITTEVPYVAVPYVERMELAYAAADLALCRAGALTCAELAAVGLPAAYVPLPIGNGEQRLNAEPVVAAGGGLMVADAVLSPSLIVRELVPLLFAPAHLARMAAAAVRFGRRDADVELARMVTAAARGRSG